MTASHRANCRVGDVQHLVADHPAEVPGSDMHHLLNHNVMVLLDLRRNGNISAIFIAK